MGSLAPFDFVSAPGLAKLPPFMAPKQSQTDKKDLTFIIPVRHPDNLRDPAAQTRILNRTFASIAAQTISSWRAVVIANHGTELPELSDGFEVVWVDYAPNPRHELNAHDFQNAMDFFRLDKGRRVWSGMNAFPDTHYFMIVDDDDYVSRDLTAYARAHRGANGWFIRYGYGIDPDGGVAIELDRFHKTCGTSHIARADLYDLPDIDDPNFAEYVKKWLGSHGATTEHFEAIDAPLSALPFHGAVYLMNNPNSHSRSNRLLRQYIFNMDTVRRPWNLFAKLSQLTRVNHAFRTEFLGNT